MVRLAKSPGHVPSARSNTDPGAHSPKDALAVLRERDETGDSLPARPRLVPARYMGRWVAWSKDDEILASGATLGEVMELSPGAASYEGIPRSPGGRAG